MLQGYTRNFKEPWISHLIAFYLNEKIITFCNYISSFCNNFHIRNMHSATSYMNDILKIVLKYILLTF